MLAGACGGSPAESTATTAVQQRSTASSACVEPPSGLVTLWRGEGNALDSVGPLDGTRPPTGGYFADGRFGRAFEMVDDNRNPVFPADAGLVRFTIEFWMRSGLTIDPSDPLSRALVSRVANDGSSLTIGIANNNGQLEIAGVARRTGAGTEPPGRRPATPITYSSCSARTRGGQKRPNPTAPSTT